MGSLNLRPPQAGKPYAIFIRGSVSEATNTAPSLDDPASNPVSVLEGLNANTENEFGEVIPLMIDGRYAARTDAVYESFEDSALVLMINEDAYIYANAFAAPGEMDDFLTTVEQVITSAALRGEGLEAADYIQDISLPRPIPPPMARSRLIIRRAGRWSRTGRCSS